MKKCTLPRLRMFNTDQHKTKKLVERRVLEVNLRLRKFDYLEKDYTAAVATTSQSQRRTRNRSKATKTQRRRDSTLQRSVPHARCLRAFEWPFRRVTAGAGAIVKNLRVRRRDGYPARTAARTPT